ISASRAGARFKSASFLRIGSFQSGIFDSGDAADGIDEGLPALALGGQDFAPLRGQPVIASPALAALLDPAALNPAAFFEAIQQRVERRRVKTERAVRPLFDQLADFVAVAGQGFEQGEQQQLGAALLPLAINRFVFHISYCHILRPQWFGVKGWEAKTLWGGLVGVPSGSGRLAIGPLPRSQPAGGGNQPPRRLPTCPTSMAHAAAWRTSSSRISMSRLVVR